MSYSLPPIAKLAERLLVDIEQAAAAFPRRHRYTFGADLRRAAMRVAKRAQRAWRDRENQLHRITRLRRAIDDLKISLQLGTLIKAFRSFGQFEALARLAAELGRQAGGWHRQQQQHPKGQNPAAPSPQERAQILSTCSASRKRGAHP